MFIYLNIFIIPTLFSKNTDFKPSVASSIPTFTLLISIPFYSTGTAPLKSKILLNQGGCSWRPVLKFVKTKINKTAQGAGPLRGFICFWARCSRYTLLSRSYWFLSLLLVSEPICFQLLQIFKPIRILFCTNSSRI